MLLLTYTVVLEVYIPNDWLPGTTESPIARKMNPSLAPVAMLYLNTLEEFPADPLQIYHKELEFGVKLWSIVRLPDATQSTAKSMVLCCVPLGQYSARTWLSKPAVHIVEEFMVRVNCCPPKVKSSPVSTALELMPNIPVELWKVKFPEFTDAVNPLLPVLFIVKLNFPGVILAHAVASMPGIENSMKKDANKPRKINLLRT